MKLSIFSVQDHYPQGPRSLAQLYDELARQAEFADRIGYHAFWIAEHHFHEYGVVPDPAVMLAALAQRTRRLRLGTAIATLPFRNPVHVAESYAMVDQLSGGRLALGVGSGYLGHEFTGFGIPGAEKRERFDESLALIRRLLAGERVTHHGRFNRLDGVALNVLPVQKAVPIYVAILRREAALHVGRQGENLMCVPYASLERFTEIGELMAAWRAGRDAAPLGRAGRAAVALHTHVAESDEAARANAAAAFDRYVASRLYAKRAVYDDVIASGLALFGSVATVAEKLLALAGTGVDEVMTLHNFGALPHPLVERSMRLLVEEVMPRVAARLA